MRLPTARGAHTEAAKLRAQCAWGWGVDCAKESAFGQTGEACVALEVVVLVASLGLPCFTFPVLTPHRGH